MTNYTHIHAETLRRHNKDEWTQFFRKIYLSLYSKGFERVTKSFTVWEVSWRLNRSATYWPPPTPLAITAFLSRSPGLLNRGPGSPASETWFSFQHRLSNWSELPVAPGYIIIWRTPTSCECHICTQFNSSTVKIIPWYLRPGAPVIDTGAFLILTARPRPICNTSIDQQRTCLAHVHPPSPLNPSYKKALCQVLYVWRHG